MAAPVVQNQRPADGDTLVAPYQPAYLEITDADADLVAASVVIKYNGRVAWTGDAAQPGFSVTKTAITNGFSYSVLPDILPARGGQVQIDVYAEDAIPNSVSDVYSYVLGIREYVLRFDDFDDASLNSDIVDPAGNGIVTEPAGTQLKLDCPNSLQCHWWTSVANAPRPYYPFESWMVRPGVFQVESKLDQFDESSNGLAYGGGPFLRVDDQNMIEIGYYYHSSYRDVRVHRGLSNTFTLRAETGGLSTPNTTPHRYRIIWNTSGKEYTFQDGSTLSSGDITFYYSVNNGSTWTRLYTEAITLSQTSLTGFGVMQRKDPAGAGDNSQAYIDYLELKELVPPEEFQLGPEDGNDAQIEVDVSGEVREEDGPGTWTPEEVGAHVEVETRGEVQDPSTDPSTHRFQDAAARSAHIEILAEGFLSALTDYRPTTNDFNGHPHFLGERVLEAFIYHADDEAGLWTTPTDPSFTGYGKDGKYYVNGVDQLTNAPWYDEAESDDRGPTKPFPDKVLICYTAEGLSLTPKEVVIFDLDNFPTTLNVWMRFKFGSSGGNYTMMGRVNQKVTALSMANGVMAVVTTEGDYRGALHLINFTQPGKDCGHYIRSDNHLVWQPATEIAGRNLTGASQWTTSGVTISLRTDEEQIHEVATLADGADTWVAIAGEDPGPNLYHLTGTPVIPTTRVKASGPDVGDANIGDGRRIAFDMDKNWWIVIEDRIHRVLEYDYKEGYTNLNTGTQNVRRGAAKEWVRLPFDITCIAAVGDYLFAGTEVGVYRVHRGNMEYALAYTIADGGGGGSADAPPAGEILPGTDPAVHWITGHPLNSAHYLHIAVGQAVVTLRTLDDLAVDVREFPSLHWPGAHFNVALVE